MAPGPTPTPVTAALLRGLPLPRHADGDNKEGRGQVLVVGGCLAVPGAVLLAAEGALRAGAGKLQIATGRTAAPHMGIVVPEAMVVGLPETEDGCIAGTAATLLHKQASRADAILVGPGMMDVGSTVPLVMALLDIAGADTGLVFDAGALEALEPGTDRLRRRAAPAIITPHAGEMAHLLGLSRDTVAADPARYAKAAASRFACIAVLKGGTTHVAAPDGEAWVFEGGTIGLGTSGSGDVLAGVIAGLVARGTPPAHAAIWGVFLHAEAGNRLTRRHGGIGLLARELPGEIPSIMAGLAEPGA